MQSANIARFLPSRTFYPMKICVVLNPINEYSFVKFEANKFFLLEKFLISDFHTSNCGSYKSFDKFILALLNLTGRTYDHGADLKPAIMDLVDPLIALSKMIPMKPKKKEAVLGNVSNATLLDADELQKKKNELQQIYDAETEAYEALYEAQLEVWKSDIKNFSRRKNL